MRMHCVTEMYRAGQIRNYAKQSIMNEKQKLLYISANPGLTNCLCNVTTSDKYDATEHGML